jgi:hypothetical protein
MQTGRRRPEAAKQCKNFDPATLKSILRNVSAHHRMTVPEVLEQLDL